MRLRVLAQVDGLMRADANGTASESTVSVDDGDAKASCDDVVFLPVCRDEVHAGDEWWAGPVHEPDIGEWSRSRVEMGVEDEMVSFRWWESSWFDV